MSGGGRVRPPAVAGTFYPADPEELRGTVDDLLAGARPPEPYAGGGLEALIVPHAGYVYSGPVAATAYRALAARIGGAEGDGPSPEGSDDGRAVPIERVLLIGPSHFVPIRGLALPAAEAFETPLGPVPVDREAVARLVERPGVEERDDVHAREHALEVQLPFLQRVLGDFRFVPLAIGVGASEEVARVLASAWEPGTLVVASSDLSHYLPYAEAKRIDRETAATIERMDADALRPELACGSHAVEALLRAAGARGLRCRLVDLRSSGDTAGPRDSVVGYGAFLLERPA